MSRLSEDLRGMGYVPTGEESPVDERGELWANSHEIICDETGIVIDGNHFPDDTSSDDERHYYYNSENVKLIGGYLRPYDWGHDGDHFEY